MESSFKAARRPKSNRVPCTACTAIGGTDVRIGSARLRGEAFALQEAFRIQAEYLQSQLKACAEDATQIGAKIAGSFKRTD